jgi:copper chaperone NosL
MERREFLLCSGSLLLAPLAGCGKKGDWPEGMAEIKWDRDTCVRCNMVISDPRFAAEMRGGEKDVAFKFDDIGCLVFWLRDKAAQHPWMAEPATRMWVADSSDMSGKTWLDARRAHYLGGRLSPMGYNFAAARDAVSGGLTFEAMREQVLAKGK